MALFLVTAPAGEPISLSETKSHLRVDVADDDALIQSLIVAAREHGETFTRRAFLTQTWDLKCGGFPGATCIELPMPPVSAVTSVTYLDGANVLQTWPVTTGYLTDLPIGPKAQRARIMPAYGVAYPSTYSVMNAVTIRFVAGYGAATDVPESLKQGMKLLITHWYEQRSSVNIGNIVHQIPETIDALLWPYKVW